MVTTLYEFYSKLIKFGKTVEGLTTLVVWMADKKELTEIALKTSTGPLHAELNAIGSLGKAREACHMEYGSQDQQNHKKRQGENL